MTCLRYGVDSRGQKAADAGRRSALVKLHRIRSENTSYCQNSDVLLVLALASRRILINLEPIARSKILNKAIICNRVSAMTSNRFGLGVKKDRDKFTTDRQIKTPKRQESATHSQNRRITGHGLT